MDILTELKKIVKNELNKEIDESISFREMGIDSIDVLNLVVKVEEKFNIQIEDEKLLKIENIKNVIEIIHEKYNK